jgi:hypothetical protein
MTADFVALCRHEPDTGTTLAALSAAGPELRVRGVEQAGLIQLCDDDGRTLVTIESPLLVRVPGEAGRLLGPGVDAPYPVWWVEARACADAGTTGHADGHAAARLFTEALAAATGGCIWPSR